jgi:hypothetical protein
MLTAFYAPESYGPLPKKKEDPGKI